MSKTSKKATKQKNLQRKRAIKAANKARYQQLALSGQNSKSKRSRSTNKSARKVKRIDHPNGKCGNPGCKKCFPDFPRNLVTKYSKA